jgi:glutathione S-transferase
MSDLTVYGDAEASRTWWTTWTCHELNLDFDNVPFGFLGSEITTDDYLAIHPNGLIPAIKDGDFVLWESMAINLYLAKKSRSPLYPKTLEGEASTWQWSFWAVTRIETPLLTLLVANAAPSLDSERGRYFLKHISAWDTDEVARCRRVLERPLTVLNSELAERDYLLGEAFTVADLNVSAILSRNCMAVMPGCNGARFDLSSMPHLVDWLGRCWARPACPRRDMLLEGLKDVS